MDTTKTTNRPADLTASTDRVRAMVLAAGLTVAELDQAAQREADALCRDQDALAKLGAPLVDMTAEWRAAGLTSRQMSGRVQFVRRAVDVPADVRAWAATCRAAAILLASAEGGAHFEELAAAKRQVWAVAQ